ncbi:MAG: hypothetical protein ACJZ86_02090 [Pontiellaceae bacterium]
MKVSIKKDLTSKEEEALLSLFEESFGCTMSSIAFLKAAVSVVWVDHDEVGLCGAALVEQQVNQNYLSKFAVTPMVRGDGVAKLMWETLCDTHPSFFWRARAGNPFSAWYMRRSDGYEQDDHWSVFWHGLATEETKEVVAYAQMRPSDFIS